MCVLPIHMNYEQARRLLFVFRRKRTEKIMGLVELLLLAVGLSMDAFAVSVCKGLAMDRVKWKHALICGAWFGGFQALMPTIGYFLGAAFENIISAVSSWIAFGLLALIGGNMIREAVSGGEEKASSGMDPKTMLLLAVATSIDALAVGITFACVPVQLFAGSQLVNTLAGVLIIGAVTFCISCAGVRFGGIFGSKFEAKAQIAGGVILILIGVKILLEHFGVL